VSALILTKVGGSQRPPNFWDLLHARTSQYQKQQLNCAWWSTFTWGTFSHGGPWKL